MKRINYLIKYLETNYNISNIRIERRAKTEEEKKKYFRGLSNLVLPKEIDKKFLKEERIYLQSESKKRKIIDSNKINVDDNKIAIWKGDITTLKINSIVNAANPEGIGCFAFCHDCIDNQVHSWAGIELKNECKEKVDKLGGKLKPGDTFITKGYNLPSKKIIHTLGPIIKDKITQSDINDLIKCYNNSLNLAKENNIREIALPCISTGIYKYPKKSAAKIAIDAVTDYLNNNKQYFDKVILTTFTDEEYGYYKEFYNLKNNLHL